MAGRRAVWAALTVVGGALPLAVFAAWVVDHGADLPLAWRSITGSPIALMAWADVAITVVAITVLAARRVAAGAARFWWVIAGSWVLGASFGLPLYLWLREDAPRP